MRGAMIFAGAFFLYVYHYKRAQAEATGAPGGFDSGGFLSVRKFCIEHVARLLFAECFELLRIGIVG